MDQPTPEPTLIADDVVARIAREAWRNDAPDGDEAPKNVDWDTRRDCWTDGFETGWKMALKAIRPLLNDGREGTHYYGDTCLGGHGELADIEAKEAAQDDGSMRP